MTTTRSPPSAGTSPDTTPPTTQLPSPSSTRRKRRIRRPAKGSLYGTMHEHAGTSLFLRPICWTDLHTRLLGARFEQLPPCDTPVPSSIPGSPPSKGHLRPSPTITTLSNNLTEILSTNQLHPILSATAVRTVLQTMWPEAFSKPRLMPEWNLYFGGRIYRDSVRAPIVWNFPAESARSSYASFQSISTRPAESSDALGVSSSPPHNTAGLPMLCYIGRGHLAAIRKNLFRVAPGPAKTPNEPVLRLQQARAKALVPSNLDHDAHFVGIFLAMAQRHFYSLPPAALRKASQWSPTLGYSDRPRFQDIKLRILTHDSETADFIVYTAHVKAKFLEKFQEPSRSPSGCVDEDASGMHIEFTRVPIWPILGLRERLGQALGPDLAGVVDVDNIETWQETEEELSKTPSKGKRKREALAEVVNSSFEDDSQDEPAIGGKKRCLTEGPPLGMVM